MSTDIPYGYGDTSPTDAIWLVRFTREGTTMEWRCLVIASSSDSAKASAVEAWGGEEDYDLIIVEPNGGGEQILHWWQEPS